MIDFMGLHWRERIVSAILFLAPRGRVMSDCSTGFKAEAVAPQMLVSIAEC